MNPIRWDVVASLLFCGEAWETLSWVEVAVNQKIFDKTIKEFLSPIGNATEGVPYAQLQITKSFSVPAMPGWGMFPMAGYLFIPRSAVQMDQVLTAL